MYTFAYCIGVQHIDKELAMMLRWNATYYEKFSYTVSPDFCLFESFAISWECKARTWNKHKNESLPT